MAVRGRAGSRMTEVSDSMTRLRSCAAIEGVEPIWKENRWRTEFGTVKFEGPDGSLSEVCKRCWIYGTGA